MVRQTYYKLSTLKKLVLGGGREDSNLVILELHAGIRNRSGRFATKVLHLHHENKDRTQWDRMMKGSKPC